MSLIIGRENTFDTKTLIYEKGEKIESVAYIIDGSILFKSSTGEITYNTGDFVAINDLLGELYLGDYYASEGCHIMAFPADNMSSFINFFKVNPAIHTNYYRGLCSVMTFLKDKYIALYAEITNVYNLIDNVYNHYKNCCNEGNVAPASFLMPHDVTLYDFDTQSFTQNFNVILSCYNSENKLDMLYNKNPEAFKKQQVNIMQALYTTYEDMLFYLKTAFSLFVSNSEDCLFHLVASLIGRIAPDNRLNVMKLLNSMKIIVTQIDEKINQSTGISLDVDYSKIDYFFMMASEAAQKENSDEDDALINAAYGIEEDSYEDVNVDFSGTLLTLCEYAGFEKEQYQHLNSLIEFYIGMSDKASREDDARVFRKDLVNIYFELYEKVFFNYVKANSRNKLVELFLDYGLLDERLLTDSHLEILANIKPLNNVKPCRVYRMRDWLTAIYRGEKMPSKNEFDKDYIEFVREKKRDLHLSPADEQRLLTNNVEKVKFEINNMLKYNCRILNGNMLAFTPMLSMYDFDGDLDSFLLTAEKVNDAINNCLAYDYSAFHREQMYSVPEKKIDKEVIQLQVFPDIVLFPVYGVNGIMWQDLSGKRSNTEGRFFFPSFFRGNIDDTMISIIARFRWELCKSITGISWNNVAVPSLTSEYADYIQFYRKNRDLSSDKKEALKNQLAKCRNNMREVFVSDYITWIKYESAGAVRLNKVARQMLATYCPFPKAMRQKLALQPLYEEAIKRFNIIQQKKIHEITMRIHGLERIGADITKEIFDTQDFYSM